MPTSPHLPPVPQPEGEDTAEGEDTRSPAFPWWRGTGVTLWFLRSRLTFSQVRLLTSAVLAAFALVFLGFVLGRGVATHDDMLTAIERAVSRSLSDPLIGQMRPPCPKPYVEDDGGCWDEFPATTPAGQPKPCPKAHNIREVVKANGQHLCRVAVMAPSGYSH